MRSRGRRRRDLLGGAAVVGFAIAVDLVIWDGARDLRGGGLLPVAVVPVVLLLVHPTLLLRWRCPRSVFALQWTVVTLGNLAVPQFQPFAGLLVALHAVASRRPPRESALWLVTLLVPFGLQSASQGATRPDQALRTAAVLLLLWCLVSLAVWVVGRRSYAAARRAWRLRDLQAAEAAEAVQLERARLARELHDTISHGVTGMLLQAAGARTLLQPADARLRDSLTLIETTGVQAMAELHRLLGLLHAVDPDAGDHPPGPGPTVADIEGLVTLAREAGRDVELLEQGPAGELDPSVATAAYRIVQEGLTNSAKHAGPSAPVVVDLHWTDDGLELSVTDRAHGPPMPADQAAQLSSGHGLTGLRERVTLVGGTLSDGPTADGYQLAARLPRPSSRAPLPGAISR